jgi:LuxR family maltose regulon positive regulatory protein
LIVLAFLDIEYYCQQLMSIFGTDIPIRNTKLYRPPVTADYVARKVLDARLQDGIALPLTLVSAPAGYGKSTSISHWLKTCDLPSAWLSLDETDNDLRVFLAYVVAAVRTISGKSCQNTLNIINADRLPPLAALAAHLSNDLEALNERIILVLDDYYHIRDADISALLDTLLQHPLRQLHLAILTRHDPLLSLTSLRARHLLTEIRMRDLEFSQEETHELFQNTLDRPITETALEKLQRNTEGWPVGVRLATMALQHQEDIAGFLDRFGADSQPLQGYLVTEVLATLSPVISEHLMYCAIPRYFNAELCEAVWADDMGDSKGPISGTDFIETIEKSDIFTIPLDDRHEWYRLHHLFRDLLVQRLESTLGLNKINALHHRASVWLSEHGYFEDAARHALAAGDGATAANIIGEARHGPMNANQWPLLEAWLKLFPEQLIEKQPQLLLLRCWLDFHLHYRLDLLARDLTLAAALIEKSDPKTPGLRALKAELASLSTIVAYAEADPSHCMDLADQALRDAPIEHECVRSTAIQVQIHSCQMMGDLQRSGALLWDSMDSEDFHTPSCKARFLMAACFAAWCEADIVKLRQVAGHLLKSSEEHNLAWSSSFAHYFIGLADYETNNLPEAMHHFEFLLQDPYRFHLFNVVSCSFLKSLSLQAEGEEQGAREVAENISNLVFDRGNRGLADSTRAFQAELDLRQGNLSRAIQWLSSFEQPPTHVMQRFYQPELTAVRVMLAQNTGESRDLARGLLGTLQERLETDGF